MSPVTMTPSVSEAPLHVEIYSGPSLAGELSTQPRRPVPCPPTWTGYPATDRPAHPLAAHSVQEAGWPRGSIPLRRAPVVE